MKNVVRPLKRTDSYDFSFSGLKSAVLNYLHHAEQVGEEINRADVAASFQAAVVDVLVKFVPVVVLISL